MAKHLLLSAFVMLCLDATADDAPFKAGKLAAMDAEITRAVKDGVIVGAALWVERRGVSHHRAFGNRALQPAVEGMTEDTVFDAASVTKAVATGSAAMLCEERGLMRLDDPVSRFLPEFTGEGREKITLKHLLLHTSGLQVNLNGIKPPFSRSSAEAYARACREKPLFEPGSAFSYSSVGSMVLGMAIECASGRAFDAFCTAEIFQPLKMHDTLFRPSGEVLRRVAPTSAPQRGSVDDTVAREMGGVSGHASLFTTTGDLARFARMMLNGGQLDGVRVFKPETIQRMTRVQSPPDLRSPDAKNLPVKRALGWDIDTPYRTPPHDYSLARGALFPIGSYGNTGWTGQMVWIDPFSKAFIVFLCNRYVPGGKETRSAVSKLHHRLSTLAAEAVRGFDFSQVPGARSQAQITHSPYLVAAAWSFALLSSRAVFGSATHTRSLRMLASAPAPSMRLCFAVPMSGLLSVMLCLSSVPTTSSHRIFRTTVCHSLSLMGFSSFTVVPFSRCFVAGLILSASYGVRNMPPWPRQSEMT